MAQVRIGTSNVVLPGNKNSFPQPYQLKSRLHYYNTLFNTVELNSTFYKLPMFFTFKKWADDVDKDFKFTVKLTKDITHAKQLSGDLSIIEKFMSAAEGVGNKKGCLLLQFPGKITLDHFAQVEVIIQNIYERNQANEWKIAVEFRHPSWYISETNELLDEYNASMVIHDMPRSKNHGFNKKAKFVYLRFHGPEGDYKGSYADALLQQNATDIKDWLKQGKDVYVYFNNTIGDAFNNALRLKNKVGVQ